MGRETHTDAEGYEPAAGPGLAWGAWRLGRRRAEEWTLLGPRAAMGIGKGSLVANGALGCVEAQREELAAVGTARDFREVLVGDRCLRTTVGGVSSFRRLGVLVSSPRLGLG